MQAEDYVEWLAEADPESTHPLYADYEIKFKMVDDTYEIVEQGRWTTTSSAVVEFPDGSFARVWWDEGSTEMQESEYNPDGEVVVPQQVTVTKYVRVD